jgi:signal transduction histidine kinase
VGVELSASSSGPDAGQDAGDRLAPLWHLLGGGVLALATAIALLDPATDRVLVLTLAAALVLWHWFLLVRDRSWLERTGTGVVYWIGTAALVTALAAQSDSFAILLYGLYPLAFITLRWWGLVPVTVLTASVGWQMGFDGAGGWVNLVATVALALVIAVVVDAVARQSEQRRAALEELAATRAELAATARRAGVLEERQRLARELHDTVAQDLTSVVTHLEAAEQAVAEQPELARTHLDTARRAARDGLGELRRSVHALRPDLLAGAPLPDALRAAADRWSADHGVPAQVRVTGEAVPLPPDTEVALLRTAQEALANTARHARAHRVVVSLSYLGDSVTLDVDDDGVGFTGTPVPRPDGGFGLVAMRERIAAVGGRLDVESAPGEGTTVAAEVPS